MSRVRASNFEVLRIVSMAGIVMQHYAGNTKWEWSRECETYSWLNEYVIKCMATSGKIGVNVFLLMTGYFLKGRPLKVSAIARTWFQTINWAYLFFLPALYFGIVESYQYKLALFPVIAHGYWFIASYMAAALCTGWIGTIAKYATPAQYLSGLCTLFIVMGVLRWPLEICYSNVSWFIFVISLGAFLYNYESTFKRIRTSVLLVVFGLLCTINYGSVYAFTFHNVQWAEQRKGYNALTRENWSILCLAYAVTMVLLAQRWEFHSAAVNKLASCTLGVYLTHENMFIAPRIWSNWVHAEVHRDSLFLPIIAVAHIATVYLVCSFAEWLRQLAFGFIEDRVSTKVGYWADTVADHLNSDMVEEKSMV